MATNFDAYPQLTNPACAWTPLREWGGLPNVKWCEETLCSLVAEPANTWSNLAYVLLAAGLWYWNRSETNRMVRFWAPTAFWVGITSLVYHASVAFVTQVLDFWGMYFFFGLVLLLNLLRLGKVAAPTFFRTLYASIFALTGVTVLVAKLGLPVQGIIGVMIVLTLATEAWATRVSATPVKHRALAGCLVFIAIAFGFSAADASRAWCDPADHVFQGHAIWHCFGAVAIGFAHFHYRQFAGLFR